MPTLASFGPEGDEGTAVDWVAYDSEPVPRHRLEALALRELDHELAEAVRDGSAALEAIDGRRVVGAAPSSRPNAGSSRARGASRPTTSPRALRLMLMAARVGVIVDEGLRLAATPSLDVYSSGQREVGLRSLQTVADRLSGRRTSP